MPEREGPRSRRTAENDSIDKPTPPKGAVGRALQAGRSGYGVESLRPHLRDQLLLKDLMRPTFPAPDRTKLKTREDD